jgi:hypothetical protein
LEREHASEWMHIKITGEMKDTTTLIKDAVAAKTDQSKPALTTEESGELDRLCARWIAKCGRSQSVSEDKELGEMLARMLELCKARFRYALPCEQTVNRQLKFLGAEGKVNARNFLVRCLKAGIRITITGDLWSEDGMGLFAMYAHGMPDFAMEKALIGLVPCESEVSRAPLPLPPSPK